MNQEVFYATAAALCFTLLGFWWVVVQFRHAELTRTPATRAFALLVSLQFMLPGFISLASLAAGEGPLWRLVFASAGLAGFASVLVAVRRGAGSSALGLVGRIAWFAAPAYALLTAVAIAPEAVRSLGLVPLQVEAFILVALLLLGVLIAWFLFVQPPDGAE
jgi:hypothetical protein